jgi:hypothetical protein
MSEFPKIQRAIPKRRYQLGDYGVTLLGEVETGDEFDYRYILAFVREGESQPTLFVCSERCPPGEREKGSHRLRVINSAMSEVMDTDDRWRDLEQFADEGLTLGMQALGLTQETPFRLS